MGEDHGIGQKVMGNAAGKKGGGGGRDMTLESRHLIGIFLGLVIICGVFFTLGYVMGRTQFETSVKAAPLAKPESAAAPGTAWMGKPAEKTNPATPAPSDWTFPTATDPKKPADRLEPPPPKGSGAGRAGDLKVELNPAPGKRETARAEPMATPAGSATSKIKPPAMPRGSVVLQVAALSKETDALALARVLQQKGFAAFVLQPMGDNLFRVQVGPYADSASADAGKKALQREGFKAILKK
jgi:cell division protein FtsN